MSIHLGGSFDCGFIFMNNAQNGIFNQKKKIKNQQKRLYLMSKVLTSQIKN